jgi:hypothetical protein
MKELYNLSGNFIRRWFTILLGIEQVHHPTRSAKFA